MPFFLGSKVFLLSLCYSDKNKQFKTYQPKVRLARRIIQLSGMDCNLSFQLLPRERWGRHRVGWEMQHSKKHMPCYCYVLRHQIHPENKKPKGLVTTEVTSLNLLLDLDLLSWMASPKWFYLSRKHHRTDTRCSRSKRWQVANWFISPDLYKLWQNQLF